MGIIEINNLTKQYKILNRREGLGGAFKDLFSRNYRYIDAVSSLTLNIDPGDIVGFLGPNGAGKSSTIKMMTGVLQPTQGEILVNGRIPTKNRVKNMQEIGVVFGQRTQLWWDLPVIESFKILQRIYRVDDQSYKENMNMFEKLIDIKSLYRQPVRNLSLGQRMLCDIAAAFLHNPSVIFLDEPTIGLDVSIKHRIRSVIKSLNQHKNTTIILTTHDLGDIKALCKRIVIIDKGTKIYDGDIDNVISLYGSYRTLKIKLLPNDAIRIEDMTQNLNELLQLQYAIQAELDSDGWIQITMNPEEVGVIQILNDIGSHYEVQDIKIEEVSIEDIIKQIYEGGI